MSQLPFEYEGRSQTFFKHRAYEEYLFQWAVRLGSISGAGVTLRMWLCDVFSGPWESRADDLSDTSVWRGLTQLSAARDVLKSKGYSVEIRAIFIEPDPAAFAKLQELCSRFSDRVKCVHLPGGLHDNVERIHQMIGGDPALIFVDPTGWKEISLDDVLALANGRFRDLLIRIPFELHRFKARKAEAIRRQITALFGVSLGEIPLIPGEDKTIEFYCEQLRKRGLCAAWMPVPDAESARTAAWLVCGGHHPTVMEVFRVVEQKVIGTEAQEITQAQERQLSLDLELFHPKYESKRKWSAEQLELDLRRHLRLVPGGEDSFRNICGDVLQRQHLTPSELANRVLELERRGVVEITGKTPRERTLKPRHRVRLSRAPSTPAKPAS